jgi:hypothetical protein
LTRSIQALFVLDEDTTQEIQRLVRYLWREEATPIVWLVEEKDLPGFFFTEISDDKCERVDNRDGPGQLLFGCEPDRVVNQLVLACFAAIEERLAGTGKRLAGTGERLAG